MVDLECEGEGEEGPKYGTQQRIYYKILRNIFRWYRCWLIQSEI